MPRVYAGVAQLVEQLICNQPVVGSNPIASSSFKDFKVISKLVLDKASEYIAFLSSFQNSIVFI